MWMFGMMTTMFKIFLQFVISGSIVVGATYLASHVNQKWAGLLVAAPLLTLITYIFLSLNSSQGDLKQYLLSALLFMIPAALFIASLYVLSGRLNFALNLFVSFIVYCAVVLAIYFGKQLL